MNELRGPGDADHFRQQVGRYGDRWYVDPLPACEIADAAPEWQAPSWSTVKGAAGKDWSFVTNKRNAQADAVELHRIADLDPTQRAQAFNAINKAGLEQAAGRGTIVHLWAEDMLHGREPRQITDLDLMSMGLPKAALDEALLYRSALVDVFETYQPQLYAAEYVACHRSLNGVGYGCTPDALVDIDGEVVGIDWKSRTADSKHGAYPEEGAQIAAGVRADYMIVADGNGGAKRALLPKVSTGLIVSIKPDGARIYPIDIDGAWRHVEAMHAFWVARQSEREFIGRVWAPKTAAGGSDARQPTEPPADDIKARVAELVEQGHADRLKAAWPFRADGTPVPTFKAGGHIDGDLELIAAAIDKVRRDIEAPFDVVTDPQPRVEVDPQPVIETSLDEGGTLDQAEVNRLRAAFQALPPKQAEMIGEIARDANTAGRSISVATSPTQRRGAIAEALIAWAQSASSYDDLWAAITPVATIEQTGNPDERLGALLSRFTIDQARRLADTFGTSAAA